MGQDLPHGVKVQTRCKKALNHELGHAVINTSFERDNGDEDAPLKLSITVTRGNTEPEL